MFRKAVGWGIFGLITTVVLGVVVYLRDIGRAYERVGGKSKVISSPFGGIEYKEGGIGHSVLVVHGSGGGYDQGELIAQAFLGEQFHWIAPSRFGYLRSTCRDEFTFDHQAHAYAALLDHLNIEKVAVIAFSHGGPSALLFAVLYPKRVSSLSLVSTGVVTMANENQKQADQMGNTLATIFKYDWVDWGITKLFKKQLMRLMGATDAVIRELTLEQQELVNSIIDDMNPVSLRTVGALFDNRSTLPGDRIAAIKARTLIIHATDDQLQRFHNAEFAASIIPDATLMRFERGGHLLMVVEQATISRAIQKHIVDTKY